MVVVVVVVVYLLPFLYKVSVLIDDVDVLHQMLVLHHEHHQEMGVECHHHQDDEMVVQHHRYDHQPQCSVGELSSFCDRPSFS